MTAAATGTHGGGGIKRVLVIKLGALGDVVLFTPQLAHILQCHTNDDVTLLTAPDYTELLSRFPRLTIVAFRRKGTLDMLRLLYWLLGQQFDVVYDLQGSLRSRIVTLLTQAHRRAGPLPSLAYTHTPISTRPARHAFERFNEVLLAAGLAAAEPVYRLPVDEQAVRRVDSWLQQQGLADRRLVLMHVGASPHWPSKRWPERYFTQLARQLAARGLQIIWLGGVAEAEVNGRLAGKVGINAAALFGFSELLALGRRACFAVSNDSGPMHVLSAANLPVYALFGPTDWQRSHALGQAARVLTHPVPCSPCNLPECPPQRLHVCMSGMTPDQVMARLEADGIFNTRVSLSD